MADSGGTIMKRRIVDWETAGIYVFILFVIIMDVMAYILPDHSNYLSLWIRNILHMIF